MLVFARRRRFCFLLVAGILLRHALITARNKYIILMIIFDLTRTQKKAGIIERAEQAPHGGRFFVGFLGAVLRIIGTSPYYHFALSARCIIVALLYQRFVLSGHCFIVLFLIAAVLSFGVCLHIMHCECFVRAFRLRECHGVVKIGTQTFFTFCIKNNDKKYFKNVENS